MTERRIRTAHSRASDPQAAVREFHAGVVQPDMGLVLFFCSSTYDLDRVAAEMNRLFPGVPVIGCTTAGEIGPAGYRSGTLTGASFPAAACDAATGRIGDLQGFRVAEGRGVVQRLLRESEARMPAGERFAFLLVDGLSVREEPLASALQDALGAIPLVGGSAGDDLRFERTWVFHDGAFHTDSAVMALVTTTLPFVPFRTQHFVPTDERLVVTEADPERRTVTEIDGLPAAEEYARLIGVAPGELGAQHFAAAPVVVRIDGADYVRAIQKVNPDGSLTFYCAIDEGLVLRVARGVDLVGNLERTFERLVGAIGPLQLVLACDCVLRNLQVTRFGLKDSTGELLRRYNAVGFSTYGEQFGSVHVSQTLTGLAIGGGDGG